mgnify:CR=1 FL=1
MNPLLTDIAYILDRSGSMKGMEEAAVTAYNQFVKAQLDVPGDALFTFIQFDDAYEVHIPPRPVQNVPELAAAGYTPRGSTALLDAIGRTVLDTDRRISALPEPQRPGKVIVAIFTDGYENASREFTLERISDLIRHYRDTQGWEFIFLAANQDAIATAGAMQMSAEYASSVVFSEKGVKSTGSAMARKIRALRMKSSGTMDQQAMEDDLKPMDQILREEEDKD